MLAGEKLEIDVAAAPPHVEGSLIEPTRRQGIGERGHGVEVRDVPVVPAQFVQAPLAYVDVSRIVRVAPPGVGAGVDAVEQAVFRVGDGEIQTGELGSGAQVDDAAVGGKVARLTHPAVPEIHAAGNPLSVRGRRRRSGFLRSRRLGRLGLIVHLGGGCRGCFRLSLRRGWRLGWGLGRRRRRRLCHRDNRDHGGDEECQ
jgi:hypothetical protein